MKAVKITVDVPPKYVNAVEDRVFLSVGQKLSGTVVLDGPGRPKSHEIRWLDAKGRLLGRAAGEFDRYQRLLRFKFDLNQSWFPVHYIECDIDGATQPIREKFFVAPAADGWETIPAITWATYPFGDFYDKLQQAGVNGIISYGMGPFDHVVEHGMKSYVDQCTFWEISVYHRPFRLFWEAPDGYKGVMHAQSPGFGHNWKALLDRYVRVRERCRKEGRMISRDDHYRKIFLRAFCPNDPGTRRDAGERFAAVVRQHKGFRPVFHNIADEAGITDQSKPFDFCYCHYCMDKFRGKLQKAYGSLGELNRQWGTQFATWYDVYPMTTDETMDANAGGTGSLSASGSRNTGRQAARATQLLNFASWADHREFMDDTFADFFAEMRRVGQAVDPIGLFSTGGCQWPDVFGGWDFCKLVGAVDAMIPYNGGGNQELIRSVGPAVKNVSPFFGDDERQVRQMWFSVIHGDAGVVFWDADGKNGRFVERPSGRLSHRGKLFGPALREFRGGVGRQMQAWKRADDPIGMLYSQPSERAHWMLEEIAVRGKKDWFRAHDALHMGNRLAWQQLIEDRQLQYRYVSYLDVDAGKIDLGQFKLFVLPETLAVSDKLVGALKQFVLDGGVLVADGRAGRMTENCRQSPAGLLDDLFGVQSGGKLELRAGGKVTAKKQAWLRLGKDAATLNVLDRDLRIAEGSGAEAAAASGQTPALIRRRVGNGWAVYLNVQVTPYEMSRHVVDKPAGKATRAIFDAVARLAGVEPKAAVTDGELGTSAGLELTRFEQRGAELYAFITNRQFRQSGVGDILDEKTSNAFERDRKVKIAFAGGPLATYNARTGKYLGVVEAVDAAVPRLTPLILARLPYQVQRLDVQAARGKLGAAVDVQVAVKTNRKAAAAGLMPDHVIHVDVYQPDGTWCYWYSGNATARAGQAAFSFIPALNDPTGAWRLAVRDSVTGTRVEKPLRIARA